MTQVEFYFNAKDKAEVARRIAAKAYQAGQHALIYTPDEALAGELDASLWTHKPLAFIPHVRCGHPQAGQTPVLIGTDPDALAAHDLLINLSDEWPACFSQFARLIEVVSHDEVDRQQARGRYRFYQERGYPLNNVDLDGK